MSLVNFGCCLVWGPLSIIPPYLFLCRYISVSFYVCNYSNYSTFCVSELILSYKNVVGMVGMTHSIVYTGQNGGPKRCSIRGCWRLDHQFPKTYFWSCSPSYISRRIEIYLHGNPDAPVPSVNSSFWIKYDPGVNCVRMMYDLVDLKRKLSATHFYVSDGVCLLGRKM